MISYGIKNENNEYFNINESNKFTQDISMANKYSSPIIAKKTFEELVPDYVGEYYIIEIHVDEGEIILGLYK